MSMDIQADSTDAVDRLLTQALRILNTAVNEMERQGRTERISDLYRAAAYVAWSITGGDIR